MPRLPTTRRAFTIIELMLVITLASMVLGSVAVLMQGVWRANRGMGQHSDVVRSIQRLATQFRSDIHSASNVESAANQLTISLPSGEVATYRLENGAIERKVDSAGKIPRRDAFPLPPNATIAFQTNPAGQYPLATLRVTYPLGTTQPELADHRTLTIEAAQGLNLNAKPQATNPPEK